MCHRVTRRFPNSSVYRHRQSSIGSKPEEVTLHQATHDAFQIPHLCYAGLMDWQANYLELSQLVSAMPTDLSGTLPLAPETHRWLGRASMLIAAQLEDTPGDASLIYDQIHSNSSVEALGGILRPQSAHDIVAILHRALARAESKAPATARGGFIGVGATFDAVQAMAKVLKAAAKNVLIIDPYADATVLTATGGWPPLISTRVRHRNLDRK